MKISAKARLISIIVAFVFMAGALIGSGAYLIVDHINRANALKGGSSIGDIIDISDRSIVNYSVYSALMDRLGDRTGGATTLENGGEPIVFTMAGRDWQVVYRDPEDDDIITVWMTKPYTTSTFGSNDTYSSSTVRTTVNNYYNTQVATYTAMSSFVRTPNQMSNTYKTAQAQNGTYDGYTSDQGALGGSEDFWLPSLYEAFSLWGLDANDRGLDDTSVSNYCWLRSGNSGISSYAMQLLSSGSADDGYVNFSRGVRPAAHISLSALEAAIPSYTVTTDVNIAEAGSVTGGGSYNYNTQATLTASANNGYEFVGWDTNGNNQYDSDEPTANPYRFTVTGNALVTAIFEKLPTTTITTNSSSYGRILYNNALISTSTKVTRESGSKISNIYAIANASYAFLYWLDSATGQRYTDNPLDFTVSTDTTLTAVFGSSMADGVAVCVESLEGATAAIGEARITGYSNIDGVDYVHFSAVAYKGYKFLGWYIMGEETPINTELSTDLALSQVQNKIIIARFIPIENQNDMNDDTDNNQTDDFI